MSRTIIIGSAAPTLVCVNRPVRCVARPTYIIDRVSKPVIITQQIVDYGTPLVIKQADCCVSRCNPVIIRDLAPTRVVQVINDYSYCPCPYDIIC